MRILLINSPVRLNARPNCIPYGLATIASVLRNAGHDVVLYDANAVRPSIEDVAVFLDGDHWDIIGLSGLITTYAWQKRLARLVREKQPKAFLISGGGLATSVPELLMDKIGFDALCIGEGEITMHELAAVLEGDGDIASVDGLALCKDGQTIFNAPRENIADLDSVPFPAWDMLPMEIYLANPIWGSDAANSSGFISGVNISRSMNIISSRGCPHNCKFCYHLFGRGQYRFRSAANIVDEVELLVRDYGVDFIGFVDDNFMASKELVEAFCAERERRGLSVLWGCHGRVDSAQPAMLARMRQAGCVWIGYGVESGSPKILKAMGKKATPQQAEKAIIATREAGIFANTTFIYGYPGETPETVCETLRFKQKLGIQVTSFYATPYPGTPLFEEFAKAHIGDLEKMILALGNATDFVINLTEFSDNDFHHYKTINDGLLSSECPRQM